MDIGVELTSESDIAIHLCHPTNFEPVKGKKNVLITMFEMSPVPDEFPEGFKKADLVLTPSTFCEKLFKPLMPRGVPLRVCKLGFDPYIFTYKKREWSPFEAGKPFLWLWNGPGRRQHLKAGEHSGAQSPLDRVLVFARDPGA